MPQDLKKSTNTKGGTLSKLVFVHDLKPSELNSSLNWLQKTSNYSEIELLPLNNLQKNIDNFENPRIIIGHLDLSTELENFKAITQELKSLNLGANILNPFNELSEIFDDKYKFSQLMLAEGFKHPETWCFQDAGQTEDLFQSKDSQCFFIKPRHGTEARDCFSNEPKQDNKPKIDKILNYDDLLVQELINYDFKFKVLFYEQNFHMEKSFIDKVSNQQKQLKNLVQNFELVIKNFCQNKSIQKPEIYSLDFLSLKEELTLLEANIRPAALFNYLEVPFCSSL